jgi:hypothetical protein
MAVTVNTITQRTAVLAGSLNGSVVTVVDDANGNTRKATLAQLRTNLLAGGTGFTASDPLVVGTVSASTVTVTLGNTAPALSLINTTPTTGKVWNVTSYIDGKLYFSVPGAIDQLILSTSGVSIASGLTVSAGGITVNGGTSTFQAISAAGAIQTTGGALAAGALYKDATLGLGLVGVVGSSDDFYLLTPVGAGILHVPTGTRNVVIDAGNLSLTTSAYLMSGTAKMVGLDANGIIQLGDTAGSTLCALPRFTGLAASTNFKGIVYLDTATAGQLVFFDAVTGARYKLAGTAF